MAVYRLSVGVETLYFFPDRILIFAGRDVGAIRYEDFTIVSQTSKFIEDGAVPSDSQIVDRTWRYVNKRGGPDKRFRDNRELPVCLYEEVRMQSLSGLNEVIQVSRVGVAKAFERAVEKMVSSFSNASSAPVAHEIEPEPQTQRETPSLPVKERDEQFHELLFDMLFCLMVVDGRFSRSEKGELVNLMQGIGVPWKEEILLQKIEKSIENARIVGTQPMIEHMLDRAKALKLHPRRKEVIECARKLVCADQKHTVKEISLFEQICQVTV